MAGISRKENGVLKGRARYEPGERELARRRHGFPRADGSSSRRDGSVEVGDGSVRRASSSSEFDSKPQQTLALAKLKNDRRMKGTCEIMGVSQPNSFKLTSTATSAAGMAGEMWRQI